MKKIKKKKKTNSQFQIGYHGEVTITVVKDDKVIKTITNHNEGKLSLFMYLAKCLIGEYATNDSPKYIRVFKGSSLIPENALTDAIFVGSTTVSAVNDTVAVAKLTFTIPGSIFTTQVDPTSLALYSLSNVNTIGNPLATIIIDEAHELHIGQDTNLVIVWELTIGNIEVNN